MGVPQGWLGAVKHVGGEGFLRLSEHLPQEAAENLMLLAEGHPVATPTPMLNGDPFLHPDAKRRFVVVSRDERVLHQALDYPLERWMVFLHPTQQALVEKTYHGPCKVSGGAGTGKTVVALHRAAYLAQSDDARVLLTTYSRALAGRLSYALTLLLGDSTPARQRVRVAHLHQLALDYSEPLGRPFRPLDDKTLAARIKTAMLEVGERDFSVGFLISEWHHVVDAHSIDDFVGYRHIERIGRGTPLATPARMRVWKVLGKVNSALSEQGVMSYERLAARVAVHLEQRHLHPYTHVIADEIQDFGPAELRLLRALAAPRDNDMMIVGDNAQRIYKARASLRACGLDVVGRSSILRLNYRTTEQIRRHADALLPNVLTDADNAKETRTNVSLLRGPDPERMAFATVADEVRAVAERVSYYLTHGFRPRDIALFARTGHVLRERAEAALSLCGHTGQQLSEDAAADEAHVSLGTMHRAKGLEFKVMILVGCEAGVLPLPAALSAAADEAERQRALEQERNLLYVAATRARERLLINLDC